MGTLCTPSERLYIGTLVKVWKKASFPKLVKIWLHWRKTMRKSVLILLRRKEMREKVKIMMINPIFPELTHFIKTKSPTIKFGIILPQLQLFSNDHLIIITFVFNFLLQI